MNFKPSFDLIALYWGNKSLVYVLFPVMLLSLWLLLRSRGVMDGSEV